MFFMNDVMIGSSSFKRTNSRVNEEREDLGKENLLDLRTMCQASCTILRSFCSQQSGDTQKMLCQKRFYNYILSLHCPNETWYSREGPVMCVRLPVIVRSQCRKVAIIEVFNESHHLYLDQCLNLLG